MRRAPPTALLDGIFVACLAAALTACAPSGPPTPPPAPVAAPPQSAMRDFDADGFADPQDRCPRETGVGPHGCPPPDSDHDGIRDPQDRCPATPETRNGFDDLDGCIDEIPTELTAITGVIKGLEFVTDKPGLRPKSHRVLDRIAAVLARYPEVRIELAGHVDSRSVAAQLSSQRAEAVRDYLAAHGVDAGRIETRGADANEPLASNKSGSGRARNRRVELTLLSP